MNYRHNTTAIRSNDRGVSPVLGAILVFGLVLALLVLAQVSLVPALNQQTEFEHNQRLVDDATAFQASAYRVAASGGTESVEVETGVRYRPMAFLVTPAAGNGRVYTEAGTVTVSGATGVDAETADYWNGSNWTTTTRTIVFDPAYREYTTAPQTRYEGTMIVNDFDGTTLLVDEGRLVDGRRITLLTVDGEVYEESTRSVVLSLRSVSTSTETVELRGENESVFIIVPSSISPEQWESEVLADQMSTNNSSDDRHVLGVTAGADGTVRIELEPNVTYEFAMSRIGVGTGYETTPEPQYLTVIDQGNATLRPNERTTVTFEVRDAFNNPVSGVPVMVNATGTSVMERAGDFVPVTTDANGRATFVYETDVDGEATISGYFGAGGPSQRAEITLEVINPEIDDPDDSIGGAINPNAGSGSFTFVNSTVLTENQNGRGNPNGTVLLVFNNTGSERTITDVRVNMYVQLSPGADGNRPEYAEFRYRDEGTMRFVNLDVGGQFANLDPHEPTFALDSSVELWIEFRDGDNDVYSPSNDMDGFFVLSLTFQNESTMVYFIPVQR